MKKTILILLSLLPVLAWAQGFPPGTQQTGINFRYKDTTLYGQMTANNKVLQFYPQNGRAETKEVWDQLLNPKYLTPSPASISGINGFTQSSGAVTASVGKGALVKALYTSDYLLSPRRIRFGKTKVLIDAAGGREFLLGRGSLTQYLAVFYNQSSGMQVCIVTPGGNTFLGATIPVLWQASQWFEVDYKGQAAGQKLEIRVWTQQESRPVSATYSYTFTGSEPAINGDQVTLRTLKPDVVTGYMALDYSDQATRSKERALFTGDWFPVTRGDSTYLASITQGSYFEFNVKGGKNIYARTYFSGSAYPSQLAVSIDGAAYQIIQPTGSPNGYILLPIAFNLDPLRAHRIKVVVKGVHEGDPTWTQQNGFLINDLTVDNGGLITPVETNPFLQWYWGDSITAGIVANGYDSPSASSPTASAAQSAYSSLMGIKFGAAAEIHGFGGSGIVVGGNGGVPGALANTTNFASGYPKFNKDAPDDIFINEGTNDYNQSVSGADFQAAYITLVRATKKQYPKARIWIIQPINLQYGAQLQAVALATGATYVNTAAYAGGIQLVDSYHPSIYGHSVLADSLYKQVLDFKIHYKDSLYVDRLVTRVTKAGAVTTEGSSINFGNTPSSGNKVVTYDGGSATSRIGNGFNTANNTVSYFAPTGYRILFAVGQDATTITTNNAAFWIDANNHTQRTNSIETKNGWTFVKTPNGSWRWSHPDDTGEALYDLVALTFDANGNLTTATRSSDSLNILTYNP